MLGQLEGPIELYVLITCILKVWTYKSVHHFNKKHRTIKRCN